MAVSSSPESTDFREAVRGAAIAAFEAQHTGEPVGRRTVPHSTEASCQLAGLTVYKLLARLEE